MQRRGPWLAANEETVQSTAAVLEVDRRARTMVVVEAAAEPQYGQNPEYAARVWRSPRTTTAMGGSF